MTALVQLIMQSNLISSAFTQEGEQIFSSTAKLLRKIWIWIHILNSPRRLSTCMNNSAPSSFSFPTFSAALPLCWCWCAHHIIKHIFEIEKHEKTENFIQFNQILCTTSGAPRAKLMNNLAERISQILSRRRHILHWELRIFKRI